jgi:hypothetical protein
LDGVVLRGRSQDRLFLRGSLSLVVVGELWVELEAVTGGLEEVLCGLWMVRAVLGEWWLEEEWSGNSGGSWCFAKASEFSNYF